MTALVTKHLPLVSGAPDGIKKLRSLILELAVRGKLVPHDRCESPVGDLLARISLARNSSSTKGKGRKDAPIEQGLEPRFDAPTGWQWVRLGDLLTKIGAGSTPLGGKQAYVASGVKFLRSQNVWNEGLRLDEVALISEETHQKMSGTHVEAGDILFNITGASIGRCAIVPDSFDTGNVSQHVTIIRPCIPDICSYLHKVLMSGLIQDTVMAVQVGVSREGLSIGKLAQFPIPLPPLDEQHRIVAKVDELMALCDRLEADQADAAAAHAQLVQALLDSLTQATDAADFRASWQRLSEHFHTLFTTEASIDTLKQTVLQLAVTGRLVPQEKSEASAVQLLAEIKRTQAALVETEGLRTSARVDVPLAEQYVELPYGWSFYRLGNLARFIDYRGRTPVKTTEGIPLITAKNVRRGFVSREPTEFIATTEYADWMTRGIPRVGDILFTTEAPLGNVALIDIGERFALAQRVICFQLHLLNTGPYLRVALMSQLVQEQVAKLATGMTATGVKASKLKELPLPIPPLAEQHRIVAKVNELMALCDQLKAQLAEARLQHAQLATALVAQAVAQE